MNILILNWKDIKNPDVGGAEIILYELSKRLIREGHKVTWFCRRFEGCRKNELIDDIEIIRRGNKLTVYLEAWKYYGDLKIKPDKVIESVNTLCWQTPLYVHKNKRIVYINQLAKEVFFYELPFPLSVAAYWLERLEYITYTNSKFICYSNSVKQDLVTFGIPPGNIFTFSLGLDHSRYKPGIKSISPLFVFVARLVKMKRADLCIMAMKQVIREYPEARLAIVGYGPEEPRLRKIIRDTHLERSVEMVNKDNLYFREHRKDNKVRLLQEAWALLLPSVKEGWGMVVTEAAACGTPSIVTNVTGLKDSVIDGKTGVMLSENPTVEELSNYMLKIIENKSLRQKLEMNAIKWASNFSWEKSFSEFKKRLDI